MTIKARNILLEWAQGKPRECQRVLSVALQNSIQAGEEIDEEIAREIIGTVENVMKNK